MIVLHADCDLAQDFLYRTTRSVSAPFDPRDPKVVPEVLLCHVFEEHEIRNRVTKTEMFNRIKKNQEERYHYFGPTGPDGGTAIEAPAIFLDFKRAYMEDTAALCAGLNAGIGRFAIVPPIYVHDLMHRFFGYLSRVGLPD